jgi:hypothetical protein
MQNNQVTKFINKLSNNETLDLSQYKDPRFCKELELYTLKKIQALLIKLSETHLSFEGRSARFYLSTYINNIDANGLNMLDYCLIAGLDNLPMMFAVLGGELHNNVVNLYEALRLNYDIEDAPRLVLKINNAFADIEQGKQQNLQTPLIKNKKFQPRPGCGETVKVRLKTHRIPLLLICIGVCCLIGTPFTVGANSNIGTIILFSVGIPALYAGLSNFQNASNSKRIYDQNESHNRTTQEGKIIRFALGLVTKYLFEVENHNRISSRQMGLQAWDEPINKIRTLVFRARNEASIDQTKVSFKGKNLTRSISM